MATKRLFIKIQKTTINTEETLVLGVKMKYGTTLSRNFYDEMESTDIQNASIRILPQKLLVFLKKYCNPTIVTLLS